MNLEYKVQNRSMLGEREVTTSQSLRHLVRHNKNLGLILKVRQRQ